MLRGNRQRDLAAQPDPDALAALRAALAQAAASCRLPAPYRDVLVAEAAGLIDASGRHLAATEPSGFLTRRGLPKAALRAHMALQPRLERVLRLLGLLDASPSSDPAKPVSQLAEYLKTREEQP